MNLLYLEYFKHVAEIEHLSNTAKKLHVSSPALCTAITRLEEELGVSLFDHIGRNIRLNENGKLLYGHTCKILEEIECIRSDFSKDTEESKSVIRLGVSAETLWNLVISSYMLEHKDVIIERETVKKDQMNDLNTLSQFDLIITDVGDITSELWEKQFILEDPPVLLVNKNHKFANKASIDLYDARNESFIALSKGFSSRSYFDNACRQAGFVPKIVAESGYFLRTELIKNDYGIAFSSLLGARMLESPDIKVVRVNYPPNPRIQTVFWKQGDSHKRHLMEFCEFLTSFFADEKNRVPKELL